MSENNDLQDENIVTQNEKINDDAESFLNSVDTYNEVINEPVDKPDSIKEGDLKESISLFITGEAILRVVDIVFPNTVLILLSFIDSDFKKIDVKKLELDESEREFYKPVGDYLAKAIIEKVNPLLFYSIIYFYRTGLIIASEYKNIKKHKTMPLKKENYENNENIKRTTVVKKYDNNYSYDNDNKDIVNSNSYDENEIYKIKQELESLRSAEKNTITDLKNEIERLKSLLKENEKKLSVTTKDMNNTDNVVTNNTEKKKRNLSPERIDKLREQAKKLHEYRKKKKENDNNENNNDNNDNNDKNEVKIEAQ